MLGGGGGWGYRGEDFKFNIVIFKRRTANNLELPRVKHLCCSYVESKHLENKDAINGALSPLSWTRLFQISVSNGKKMGFLKIMVNCLTE